MPRTRHPRGPVDQAALRGRLTALATAAVQSQVQQQGDLPADAVAYCEMVAVRRAVANRNLHGFTDDESNMAGAARVTVEEAHWSLKFYGEERALRDMRFALGAAAPASVEEAA